jgi:hypothetical protein
MHCLIDARGGTEMVAAAMNIGITDIFLIFIVLTSLQPVVKQRLLEASRRLSWKPSYVTAQC